GACNHHGPPESRQSPPHVQAGSSRRWAPMMKEARVAGTFPTTRQRWRVPFSIRTSPGSQRHLRAIVELECQVAGENDPEIRRVGPVKAGVSSTEFVAILEVHLGSGFWCNEVSRQVRPDDEADAT